MTTAGLTTTTITDGTHTITDGITTGTHITDFVISCRVANKKIEPSVINYLAGKYGGNVFFHYKQTSLNGPMFKTIGELGMSSIYENGEHVIYRHDFRKDYLPIVDIKDIN